MISKNNNNPQCSCLNLTIFFTKNAWDFWTMQVWAHFYLKNLLFHKYTPNSFLIIQITCSVPLMFSYIAYHSSLNFLAISALYFLLKISVSWKPGSSLVETRPNSKSTSSRILRKAKLEWRREDESSGWQLSIYQLQWLFNVLMTLNHVVNEIGPRLTIVRSPIGWFHPLQKRLC